MYHNAMKNPCSFLNCYPGLVQDSFYRGLTPEESKLVHEYNFDHPGTLVYKLKFNLR